MDGKFIYLEIVSGAVQETSEFFPICLAVNGNPKVLWRERLEGDRKVDGKVIGRKRVRYSSHRFANHNSCHCSMNGVWHENLLRAIFACALVALGEQSCQHWANREVSEGVFYGNENSVSKVKS